MKALINEYSAEFPKLKADVFNYKDIPLKQADIVVGDIISGHLHTFTSLHIFDAEILKVYDNLYGFKCWDIKGMLDDSEIQIYTDINLWRYHIVDLEVTRWKK